MRKLNVSIFLVLLLLGCHEDQSSSGNLDTINIRLKNDPKRIHAIFSPTTVGREVYQYIFTPLADFHPEDLRLTPILITEIPKGRKISGENGEELLAFDLELKPDAKWSDGTDLSYKDYAFTVKAVKHQLSKATSWRTYYNFFKDVVPNPNDENKFTVIIDGNYMLADELSVAINLLPAHIYDKDGLLKNLPIADINNEELFPIDSTLVKFFEVFNNTMNEKTDVVQLGPYRITDFQSDQYIVLEKVDDYWGNNYPDNPFLQSNAQQLVFKIIPDELTAITMAKEGKLDLLSFNQANAFLEFSNNPRYKKEWSFHTPQLMRYYYIAMNNKQGLLSDKNIRKALAHSIDVDDIIENLDGGLGIRTVGHFHPTKSYYNHDLSPVKYDIVKATEYLYQSGWSDLDEDGYLVKNVDGLNKLLELEILITGSKLSQTIALIIQEGAAKAGIKVKITSKPTSRMREENFSVFEYDMAALVVSQSAATDDPYLRWHSDNAIEGGSNSTGYSSPISDSLITVIRNTQNVSQRKMAFKELQRVMYEDQPVIFLYCPLMKIAINNRLNALSSAKRPGYMANTFTLR